MKFIHSATLLIAELLTFIFILTFMFMVVGRILFSNDYVNICLGYILFIL